jgi:hypothetical protein
LFIGGDVARADDLNYFIVSSMDQHTRLANESALIMFYLKSLTEASSEESRRFIPSVVEFSIYFKMATQGMVYRCLLFNLMLRNAPAEVRFSQLQAIVNRTCDAIVDHGLYHLLAVGR